MLKLPKNEGLNIIPFIDVMLVLLAIVLSISTFITHGEIKINLPQSQGSNNLSENKHKITISIDKNNVFYLDKQVITPTELATKINSIDLDTTIELKSDKDAKFENFIHVIEILKSKNHENFKIITEK